MKILKELSKVFFAILLLFGLMLGYDKFGSSSIKEFCSNLSIEATPEEVVGLAKTEGFIPYGDTKENTKISILNKKSPLGRRSCEVHYQDGRQINKKVVVAD